MDPGFQAFVRFEYGASEKGLHPGGAGWHLFPQKDAWPDWGCRWPGEPSECLWRTLSWPLPVSLFLSCLYVSSSAPLCSFSHDALPHHRLRKKQFTVHQNCEPRGRTFPCSLLGHFLTAVFSSDTHSRKRCHDSTRGGRVGIPGKTQLYRTENVIQHTQMAERTKIIQQAVQYLWNPSLHLGKQGYSHTRLATGESKPPNKSGLLFWCKIIVL